MPFPLRQHVAEQVEIRLKQWCKLLIIILLREYLYIQVKKLQLCIPVVIRKKNIVNREIKISN